MNKTAIDKSYLYSSVFKFNPTLSDPGFGSDAVVLDLEDGVHDSVKTNAKAALTTLDLNQVIRKDLKFGVRINQLSSIEGIRDLETVYTLCELSKEEGFTGKAIIHPLQVPIVNKIYSVSDKELQQYHFIIQKYKQATVGFSIDEGMIIAPPFVARAEMMLHLYSVKNEETQNA